MNNNMIASLKMIYKPAIMYYGEWDFLPGLKRVALEKRKKNLYAEFIDRYYYKPLMVIFKDEDIVNSFRYAICSRIGAKGRELFFSKKVFLSNLIPNVEEIYGTGEHVFQDIKKSLRERKDKFRDVDNYGLDSKYYRELKREYKNYDTDMKFEDFISFCRKKYTRLLTGYNAVLELFDKPINIEKFMNCFDIDKLYLHTAYSILQHSKHQYDLYGRVDYNLNNIDAYKLLIEDIRRKDSFYNSYILINNVVYTVDDLFKEYDMFTKEVNGK